MIALLFPDDRSGAEFSSCRRYRYRLWRRWGDGPWVCWIMLNPSTATATEDDPTIRRCISFSKRWGCGSLDVVNLFAFRSTDPAALKNEDDPVGPENNAAILKSVDRAALVVAAWGVHGTLDGRDARVKALLSGRLQCLGTTKEGHPRHPLYVAGSTALVALPTVLS